MKAFVFLVIILTVSQNLGIQYCYQACTTPIQWDPSITLVLRQLAESMVRRMASYRPVSEYKIAIANNVHSIIRTKTVEKNDKGGSVRCSQLAV